jgi:hypothetical protein
MEATDASPHSGGVRAAPPDSSTPDPRAEAPPWPPARLATSGGTTPRAPDTAGS